MEPLVYKRFYEKEQAIQIKELLVANGIVADLNVPRKALDEVFIGNDPSATAIELRIQGADFEKANEIILKFADYKLSDLAEDHYLFEFSNEELWDILKKPDEWSVQDYVLANQLLKQRGKPVTQDLLNNLKSNRMKELAKPDKGNPSLVLLGYILAFGGGLVGLIIGLTLVYSKKTLPNGERLHRYSKKERAHGGRIVLISLVVLPLVYFIQAQDAFQQLLANQMMYEYVNQTGWSCTPNLPRP